MGSTSGSCASSRENARLLIGQIATQGGALADTLLEKAPAVRRFGSDQAPHCFARSRQTRIGTDRFRFDRGGGHAGKGLARSAAEVAAMNEVLEFYRLAGNVDYFLRAAVPGAAAFDVFYKRLLETMPLKKVTSRFVLENIKSETAFPIDS